MPRKGSTYTVKAADEICQRIAEGEPLRQICRDEHMPPWRTVYGWLEADKDFAARIAHARQVGFDAIAEECLEIMDDGRNDYIERETKSGETYLEYNAEHVQRSKLRVEGRLKLLAKWDPKRFGDRVDLTSSDGSMSPKGLDAFYGGSKGDG